MGTQKTIDKSRLLKRITDIENAIDVLMQTITQQGMVIQSMVNEMFRKKEDNNDSERSIILQ